MAGKEPNSKIQKSGPPRGRGPVVGPRLRKALNLVFGLFAVLGVNSFYLASVSVAEWKTGQTIQNYFYQYMFLAHLILGLMIVLPLLWFGVGHWRKARNHRNRRAVKVGYVLFFTALVVLGTGVALTRSFVEVKDPTVRGLAYWAHVVLPLIVIWLFVLHRLAGKRIKWKLAYTWAAVAAGFAAITLFFQFQDPRKWNQVGPESAEQYFFPSLARTANGSFIPAETLMMDDYCLECHPDIHSQWAESAHRFSSFNNPAYLFSVRETRNVVMERDGSVKAARFCAGCHDPVPFFSGLFDDPNFDDENHPTAHAGITCTSCHAITHINSNRGNSDYTIEEPLHYPFAFSDNAALKWINHQLVKAKPAFHKKTFLKPLHQTAEFCGACHKVHLGEELNNYKWIRGQNHYDSFLLSGVSGHGVLSFYYPEQAEQNCNGCHMQALPSDDFGARRLDDTDQLKVHDHLFPSANTALPHLLDRPRSVIERHREFLEDSLRVDIFALRADGRIDGELIGPIRPNAPALEPGKRYLMEVVVRTLTLGHHFTQGTADSNEIWLDVALVDGSGVKVGRSGHMADDGSVDPWSHFVNAYVLDREGNRIDRRNAQDIFVPLYNHQIPPGAADSVHFSFTVPEDAAGELTATVKLRYRKFDTTYMKYVYGQDYVNDLPIITIAEDEVVFRVGGSPNPLAPSPIPLWQRWNDYGIGLLRKGQGGAKGQFRQAEEAFAQVEALSRGDGPLNLARVYLREGRLDDAADALRRAAAADTPARWWSVAWFSAMVDKQNGLLDEALANFKRIIDNAPRDRGFDFSKDYRLLNEYAQTLFERAKQERGEANRERRELFLRESVKWFERALAIDSENVTAHYNLSLLYGQLGDAATAESHRALHAKYKPDDNARDRAIARHRAANPAADHAAEAVVIYDLQRADRFQ